MPDSHRLPAQDICMGTIGQVEGWYCDGCPLCKALCGHVGSFECFLMTAPWAWVCIVNYLDELENVCARLCVCKGQQWGKVDPNSNTERMWSCPSVVGQTHVFTTSQYLVQNHKLAHFIFEDIICCICFLNMYYLSLNSQCLMCCGTAVSIYFGREVDNSDQDNTTRIWLWFPGFVRKWCEN